MATFKILEDLENIHRGQILSKKSVLPLKDNGVKKLKAAENRGILQALTNGVRHDAKRVKLSENVEEKIKPVEKKIKIQDFVEIVPDLETKEIRKEKLAVKNGNNLTKLSATANGTNANVGEKDNKNETEGKDDFPYKLEYCAEYRQDIVKYLYQIENAYPLPKLSYMDKQLDLSWNTRSILIDWLVSVAEEYKLCRQTLHLSVYYIDRFLSQISVLRTKFQLLGAAAMLLAGKMEEIFPIDVKEWAYLTGDTFSTRQIMKMEQLIAKVLRFRMHPPTMFNFIEYFCSELQMDSKTLNLAMYLSELVLLEGDDYLAYVPSKLAASSVVLARYTLDQEIPCPTDLKQISGYSPQQLSPVVEKQLKTFRDSPLKNQQAIQNKYKLDKYDKVALLKPRVLILDFLEQE